MKMDLIKLLEKVSTLKEYRLLSIHCESKELNSSDCVLSNGLFWALSSAKKIEIEYIRGYKEVGASVIILEKCVENNVNNINWKNYSIQVISLFKSWLNSLKLLLPDSIHSIQRISTLVYLCCEKDVSIRELCVLHLSQHLLDITCNSCVGWQSAKNIIKELNRCVADSSREMRAQLSDKFQHYFCQLSKVLLNCGEYDSQTALLELLLRWLPKRSSREVRERAARRWFPMDLCSRDAVEIFHERTFQNYDEDSRLFLNALNKGTGRVSSFQAHPVHIGKYSLISVSGDLRTPLWIDFNHGVSTVSIYCSNRSFGADNSGDFWEIVKLHTEMIDIVVAHYIVGGIQVLFTLNRAPELTTCNIEAAQCKLANICFVQSTVDSDLYTCLEKMYAGKLQWKEGPPDIDLESLHLHDETKLTPIKHRLKQFSEDEVSPHVVPGPSSVGPSPGDAMSVSACRPKKRTTSTSANNVRRKVSISKLSMRAVSSPNSSVSSISLAQFYENIQNVAVAPFGVQREQTHVTPSLSHISEEVDVRSTDKLVLHISQTSMKKTKGEGSKNRSISPVESVTSEHFDTQPLKQLTPEENVFVERLFEEALSGKKDRSHDSGVNEEYSSSKSVANPEPNPDFLSGTPSEDPKKRYRIFKSKYESSDDSSECIRESQGPVRSLKGVYARKHKTVQEDDAECQGLGKHLDSKVGNNSEMSEFIARRNNMSKEEKKASDSSSNIKNFTNNLEQLELDGVNDENLTIDQKTIDEFFEKHVVTINNELQLSPTIIRQRNTTPDSDAGDEEAPDIISFEKNEILECLNSVIDVVCKQLSNVAVQNVGSQKRRQVRNRKTIKDAQPSAEKPRRRLKRSILTAQNDGSPKPSGPKSIRARRNSTQTSDAVTKAQPKRKARRNSIRWDSSESEFSITTALHKETAPRRSPRNKPSNTNLHQSDNEEFHNKINPSETNLNDSSNGTLRRSPRFKNDVTTPLKSRENLETPDNSPETVLVLPKDDDYEHPSEIKSSDESRTSKGNRRRLYSANFNDNFEQEPTTFMTKPLDTLAVPYAEIEVDRSARKAPRTRKVRTRSATKKADSPRTRKNNDLFDELKKAELDNAADKYITLAAKFKEVPANPIDIAVYNMSSDSDENFKENYIAQRIARQKEQAKPKKQTRKRKASERKKKKIELAVKETTSTLYTSSTDMSNKQGHIEKLVNFLESSSETDVTVKKRKKLSRKRSTSENSVKLLENERMRDANTALETSIINEIEEPNNERVIHPDETKHSMYPAECDRNVETLPELIVEPVKTICMDDSLNSNFLNIAKDYYEHGECPDFENNTSNITQNMLNDIELIENELNPEVSIKEIIEIQNDIPETNEKLSVTLENDLMKELSPKILQPIEPEVIVLNTVNETEIPQEPIVKSTENESSIIRIDETLSDKQDETINSPMKTVEIVSSTNLLFDLNLISNKISPVLNISPPAQVNHPNELNKSFLSNSPTRKRHLIIDSDDSESESEPSFFLKSSNKINESSRIDMPSTSSHVNESKRTDELEKLESDSAKSDAILQWMSDSETRLNLSGQPSSSVLGDVANTVFDKMEGVFAECSRRAGSQFLELFSSLENDITLVRERQTDYAKEAFDIIKQYLNNMQTLEDKYKESCNELGSIMSSYKGKLVSVLQQDASTKELLTELIKREINTMLRNYKQQFDM